MEKLEKIKGRILAAIQKEEARTRSESRMRTTAFRKIKTARNLTGIRNWKCL